jgi:hypothetical protein
MIMMPQAFPVDLWRETAIVSRIRVLGVIGGFGASEPFEKNCAWLGRGAERALPFCATSSVETPL